MEFLVEFFLTNETALLLTKEVDRFGLSSLFVPKFWDISHFLAEMLPQGGWHQVIDKWYGNCGLIRKKVIPRKVLPFSRKKFTRMNRTFWNYTAIVVFVYTNVRATYLNVQWAQFKQNNLRDIAYSIGTYFDVERIFWRFISVHLDLKMVLRCG